MWLRPRDAKRPRRCQIVRPHRGRGECRVPVAPAASCALCSGNMHTSRRVHRNRPASPHAMVLTAYVALPGDRACLPPSPANMECPRPVGPTFPPRNLTPASGRQDHTILPYAATSLVRALAIAHRPHRPALPSRRTLNAAASTASRPNVRDDHDTPLLGAGMGKVLEVIWGVWKQKYFCKGGLDR
jgi:hypothetical protein